MATGQSQPRLDLSPVVAGVQHASPERPDPLSRPPAEERHLGRPPRGAGLGELRQSLPCQEEIPVQVGLDRRWFTRWQQFVGWRFLSANELGEEPAPERI